MLFTFFESSPEHRKHRTKSVDVSWTQDFISSFHVASNAAYAPGSGGPLSEPTAATGC